MDAPAQNFDLESQGPHGERTRVYFTHISGAAVLVHANGHSTAQWQGHGGLHLGTQYSVAELDVPRYMFSGKFVLP